MYFDIYKEQGAQEPYYFVAKGNNNEAVFRSGTYVSKQGAMNAIDMVKREASGADVFDETGEG
jgi:uncharacterized protein YegP (UPF0339 family)